MKPVILLGAGGHAKVLLEILRIQSIKIIGVTDPIASSFTSEVDVLGSDEVICEYDPDNVFLVNGVGSVGDNSLRKKLFQKFKAKGYRYLTLIHPSAIVATDVFLSEGVQVMAGAIIQPGCSIKENTIVNTRASVDHDCLIGAHGHIAPGVTLSGNVTVGDDVHIGTGASVINNVRIGANSIVGAGAVVIRNVREGAKVMGVPATEV